LIDTEHLPLLTRPSGFDPWYCDLLEHRFEHRSGSHRPTALTRLTDFDPHPTQTAGGR
jgi:hypothetical protein